MAEFINPKELEELYELETEPYLEDQDIRLLKAIVSDSDVAKEFCTSYDSNLFVGDAKNFSKILLDYYASYGVVPSKRIMLEIGGESQLSNVNIIWDQLDLIKYDKSEFRYDLDKIKNRYAKNKVLAIKQAIDDLDLNNANYDNILKDLRCNIEETEKFRRGTRAGRHIQKTLKEYLPEFRTEYIKKSKDPEYGRGILTGYSYLDYITNGLQPSDMLVIAGETGAGKAQPLQTLIPTPTGFKKLENIHPGDQVIGMNGKPCNVIAESEIIISDGWRFIFNDGSEVVSHNNHEWLTFSISEQQKLHKRTSGFRNKRKLTRKSSAVLNIKPRLTNANKNRISNLLPPPIGTIRETKEIVDTLFIGKRNRRNHSIQIAKAIELPEKNLLIEPYLFGLWLGDGSSGDGNITTMDDYIVGAIRNSSYQIGAIHTKKNKDGHFNKASTYKLLGMKSDLRNLKVLSNKHIPHDYLWASKEQRLALLQGLMDTDGFVSKTGQIDFVNTNENIAEGVAHLIRSLGEKCTITKGEAKLYGRITGPKWTVRFSASFPAFRLPRKLERQNLNPRLNKFRYIKNAIKTNAVPMKCIQVDSPDHLYLTGKDFIPTHNSILLNNIAIQIWIQNNNIDNQEFNKGFNVQYFSLEMPFDQCFRRTISRLGFIPTYGLRDANISDPEILKRLASTAKFIKKYSPEFEIVDIPRGVTVKEIEDKFLAAVSSGHKPDVVVVDYLGLMDTDSKDDDWLKLGKIAGELHEFARIYNTIVLTAVQLNRPKGKDQSDIIGLHRIGRSALIMTHASIGIQIETRIDEDTYDDLPYHIIKMRNGERGKHYLKKNFRCSALTEINPYKPNYDDSSLFTSINPAMEDISSQLERLGWNE